MSTNLLKHYDQKNSVQQRKNKIVSGTNNDDESDKFTELFPKCKPRLALSPTEKQSAQAEKSMDRNANCNLKSSSSRHLNKHNVNSFTVNSSKKSITTVYPGNARRLKSESEKCNLNSNCKERQRSRMEVSNCPDSTVRFHSTSVNPGASTIAESPTEITNAVSSNIQNSMFLRDSRIEIAGGRELYSQSRNRGGRRVKEQQLRTVFGPKERRESIESEEVHNNDRTEELNSVTNRTNDTRIWEPHEKKNNITVEPANNTSSSSASHPHSGLHTHTHRGHQSGIVRNRHSFPGYSYSGYGSASTSRNMISRGNSNTSSNSNNRRSRTAMEFPPTSFPQVHSTPLTIKETVFGSEITSIEKSITEGGRRSAKIISVKVDEDVNSEGEKPYIYETPINTRGGSQIVFDDIDEYELDEEQHYSPQLHLLHSLMKDSSNKESEKSKRGEKDNTSPTGYESDECSLPAPQEKSSTPNGNKRLIGTLPIADYERSPKRYGLNSRQQPDNSCSDSTIRQQTRVPSPNNIYPKPGFPQRVTQLESESSQSPAASSMTSQSQLEPESLQSSTIESSIAPAVDPNKMQLLEDNRPSTTTTRPDILAGPFKVGGDGCPDEYHSSLHSNTQQAGSSSSIHSGINELPLHQFSEQDQYAGQAGSTTLGHADSYMYEFSETKKVLEEFFKGGGAVGTAYNTTTSLPPDEVDYILRRQNGNSYVGQRLAGELSLVEESPKLPPRRGGREVVMSLDMNPKDSSSAGNGNGSSLRLITFHEVSRASVSPASRSSQQGDLNRDVNDNDIETTSTNTETDLGDTEVGLQVGCSRNFTLSPETTDCDSNELESEMSLDYEASVHSSTRVGATMPILEDGLSSGNISEAEDENVIQKSVGPSTPTNSLSTLQKSISTMSANMISHNIDSVSNPTILLMKKQISEIEKEIRMRATQQQSQQNGGINIGSVGSNISEQQSQSCDIVPIKRSCPNYPPVVRVTIDEGSASRFDSNDPELEALDPMRPTPPPSPAPGSALKLARQGVPASSPGVNAISSVSSDGLPDTIISDQESVSAALKDIKEAIQKTKHLHNNTHQIPRFDASPSEVAAAGVLSSPSSQTAHETVPSPVWVPRKTNHGGISAHRQEQSDHNESMPDTRLLREPLLRKSRYEETVVDDVSDADTDQETDRLLGQNRTDDDYGFYDEKEKDGVKKKRSKEDLLKNPTVLIEGVLFRARYLGSTQLECEGQPTKATRMIQAEEAVSRIKPEESNENGENLSNVEPSLSSEICNSHNLTADKKREESCVGCEYEDYLYALGGDESEDDSYEEYYGRKSHGNRLGLKITDNNKKLDGRCASLTLQDPLNSSTSSSASSSATARALRIGSSGNVSLSKIASPSGSLSSLSTGATNSLSTQQIIPFHLSPPCGSALPGTIFHLRFVGSLEVEEEAGIGKKRRKRPKKIMVEEAVMKLKAPEGETQPSTEVDLFISTEKIMVLNTDLKEIMMDHALRTISYIADIGDLVVLMARRRPVPTDTPEESKLPRPPKMICHVFESDEASYIAQSIGQAFQVAYMEFLKANGIEDHSFVREMDYQEVLNSQEIFGDELQMFAKKELQKEVVVPKTKGEILGVVIVESGWGSLLPTVVIANLAPAAPAARCGQLNIGDQIIAINGVSLVGLPLSTCQNYIKNSKTQTVVKLTVVPCPPVVEVKIKRPDTKYQLGFSVQNGVICSLLRGGIAERGGVRVGHRIIEINNQSVVAVPHEKIVNLLATSVGEINMKTMPTSMFRLLTGQETPLYI